MAVLGSYPLRGPPGNPPGARLKLIIHAMSFEESAKGGRREGAEARTLFNIYEHNRFSNYN